MQDIAKRVPRIPRRALYAVFLTAWVLFVIMLLAGPESPERHGEHYYSDRDGHRTEISFGEYQTLRGAEQRLFTTWSVGAMAMIIPIVWGLPRGRTHQAGHEAPQA